MRRLLPFLVLLAACSHAASSASGPGSTSLPGALAPNATLVSVTDGDTVTVRIGERDEKVRLIGIDTPETKKPNTPVQCFGHEATGFTTSLLPRGTRLHVERDVEARDVYGRLLAYVYRADDGLFVNLEIIRSGFARVLSIEPNTAHRAEFVAAARDAEQENIGLWASCTG